VATYTIKLVVAGEDQASGPLRKSKDAVDGLGDSSDKSGPKIRGFAEIATGALRRMGELATEAALGAGQAIAGFVAQSISQAGDFEAGMNRFGAVVGSAMQESGQSLDSFKQLFLDMGAQTQYSAAQAQDAAINLAKGGIDPATLAAGGLEAAMNLAAAGELDLADAAEISAKQFGVWVDASASAAEKAAFLAKSSDLLAQAANASTVDVDDLALGMANAGGVAKLAGASFQETVQTMALLAPGFSSAADAGTSFKTFLSRLVPQTDAQAAAMARLGLLTSEGTSRFYDANGAFIGMEGAAQLLQGSLKGLNNEQKQVELNAIFGADAIRAAAIIAENGADGFNRMGDSMSAAGTAAQQAAARQQGFAFALESAKGSLETFGIVAGSLVLPALTALLQQAVIPAINGVTTFAQALGDPSTRLGTMAKVMANAVVPGLIGLSAATAFYAVSQIPVMIAAVSASSTVFMAQAAAIAATLLPLAAVAAAVTWAAASWNDYSNKVDSASTQLLESRGWWNASTQALKAYEGAQLSANKNIAASAATVKELRSEIQGELEDMGRRMSAGMVSEQQYATEMAAINAKADALKVATGNLDSQIAAENRAAAAGLTATQQAQGLRDATADMGSQASLTASDIEALGNKIAETYAQGGEAVAAYVSTQASFLDGAEERRSAHADQLASIGQESNDRIAGLDKDHTAKMVDLAGELQNATTAKQREGILRRIAEETQSYEERKNDLKAANAERLATEQTGFTEREQQAAASYIAEQAAQRAHLGQMLVDYVVSQATLGNISKDKAAEITGALEQAYGLQESSTATVFLNMAGEIDKFASSSGGSVQTLIGHLGDQEQAAIDTERAMTDMSKEYVATAVTNFTEKGGEAEDYAKTLRGIPGEVRTRIVTSYSEERDGPGGKGNATSGRLPGGGTYSGTRATGGTIPANTFAEVTEVNRPELLSVGGRTYLMMGGAAGTVTPASPEAPVMGAAGGGGGGATIQIQSHMTITGNVIDNEARLAALSDRIAERAVELVAAELSGAVDLLYQSNGAAQ
jgi:TP901 family phage tail tape measure protein